jgi:A/G-specific adenine glycosylase
MDAPAMPEDDARRGHVQHALRAWYRAAGRDLPWRHTRDPYAVLVSEVMLQQTQVERVLPKYREFLERFPTLEALAAAPTADVIRAWAPLGYNVRAVRLWEIARQAVARFGGSLPPTLDGLLELKGIGRYTAGAVACFALGLPVATVDTNIRRVLWRVFRGIEPAEWPSGMAAARTALALAEWALPRDPAGAYDWQQALMDLGATICGARRPACEHCPLTTECAAYAEVGRVTLFPSGEALARLRAERAAHSGGSAAMKTAADTSDRVASDRVAEERAGYAVGGDGGNGVSTTRRGGRRPAAQPFTSTSRYFRGRALAALRALAPGDSLALPELGPRVKPDWTEGDLAWLRDIVAGLARDGLVRLDDADEGGAERVADMIRVALP